MPIIGSFGAGAGSGFGQRQASGPQYVEATGGTEFTVGDYKIHVFTGDDTLCVTSQGKDSGNNKVDYMVVAGGGGGGTSVGGGGGAGGFRESQDPAAAPLWTASPLVSSTSLTCIGIGALPVTVGGGGALASPCNPLACRGGDSIFSTITSTGGGGGGPGGGQPNQPGGSGGGASRLASPAGTGNTPPVSPPQGQPGATGPNLNGGGGGGASAAGSSSPAGNGVATAIGPSAYGECSSCQTYFSGGGGGGSDQAPGFGGQGGTGGLGGGGRGGCRQGPFPPAGEAGDPNTGGGGGARGLCPSGPGNNGGSGIVIIRYKFQN